MIPFLPPMIARTIVLILLATLLASCGNKGSLYLPDESPDSQRKEKRS